MGVVVLLCLMPSAAAVTVGVLRAWSRSDRPGAHPAVLDAEVLVRAAFAELAPLYDTPTPSGPPAR